MSSMANDITSPASEIDSLQKNMTEIKISESGSEKPGMYNGENDSKVIPHANEEIDGRNEGNVNYPTIEFALPSGYAVAPTRDHDECYNMNYPRRGHCIIFNHKSFLINNLGERTGTIVDRDNAGNLFKNLGFEVRIFDDLSVKQIKEILDKYALVVDHSMNDCLVVIFMSHGEDGHLYGRDNLFKSEILFEKFTADNCPSLAGKPKLFFIQACRGENLDAGTTMVRQSADQTDGSYSMYKIPNHADFLVSWSTIPGHYSWRNTSNGSWFMQSVVKVFSRYSATLDVMSMMTHVNRYMVLNFESNCPSSPSMHGMKQTASVSSTLLRFIHLKPKQ